MKVITNGKKYPWTLRLTAALLTALLLASCSNSGEQQETDSAQTTVSTTAAETTVPAETVPETTTGREDAKDNIPADLRFDGMTFNVIYRNDDWNAKWNVIGSDNTGELVQDAIWLRNRNVEDRFGITMNIQPSQATVAADVNVEVKAMVMAGSDEYDMISGGGGVTVKNGLYPYMYELSEMNYLDIDNPWWYKDAIMELSFDREHYRFLMGDLSLNIRLKCGVVYYNKDIYAAVNDGADPNMMYKTVLDGQWTYDFLMEMTSAAYADTNGDGVQNSGDQFGLMLPKNINEATPHLVFSCGIVTNERTGDGKINLSAMNNEKTIAVIDKLIKLAHNTQGVYISDKTIDASPAYFASNKSLFYTGRLSNAVGAAMREMESDYGILPMPKYDEDQKDYITYIHSSATFNCVPKSVDAGRFDMIGAVLEGWSSEAYRTVITPFIDTALKLKYSRDSYSGQVIDLIFESPFIDFLDLNSSSTGSLYSKCIAASVNNGSNVFASETAARLEAAQKNLDAFVAEQLRADE